MEDSLTLHDDAKDQAPADLVRRPFTRLIDNARDGPDWRYFRRYGTQPVFGISGLRYNPTEL